METDTSWNIKLEYNSIEDEDFSKNKHEKDALSALRWKNACIKALRFRRQLKNGTYFKCKTIRDIAGQHIDIAAIDYHNGVVAAATSKRKNI